MAGSNGRSGGNRWLKHDGTKQDGGPKRPDNMPEAWNAKWDELLSQLEPLVQTDLRRIDVHQLRALVTLLVHEEQLASVLASDPADQKSRRLYLGTVQSIGRLSSLFGLSVADRKRLDLRQKETSDDADEWSDD